MTTRIVPLYRMALVTGLLTSACAPFDAASISQPAELTGRWARLRADQTWGDTVVLQANGIVIDAPHTVADSLRWSVVQSRVAGVALCLGPPRTPHCEPYRLEGDTLVVGRLPTPTFFRRAH